MNKQILIQFYRITAALNPRSKIRNQKSEMSIRIRLTLWYTAVLTVFIVGLGIIVYGVVAYNLVAGLDRTLQNTAKQIVTSSQVRSYRDVPVIALPELNVFGPSIFIQAIDREGDLALSSSNLARYTSPLDETGLRWAMNQRTPITRDIRAGSASLRALTVPLIVDGELAGLLQIGTPRGQVDAALYLLLVVLIGGGTVAVIASALVGRLLAAQALRPIDEITKTALAISRADDLDKRISRVGPQDEVGRLATTFNIMLDRLEGLFRAQQRFIADISHELRNPLTTIRGNVELMRRMDCIDPPSLDAIQAESDRMIRMVGDLLLLAQADAGQPIRRERVELDTLMLEVFRQVRPLTEGYELVIGEEDQACVLGDPDRLKQLLLNLVDNAIKYTPQGGRVTLSLQCDDGWARLSVADTGIGIPPEDLPHIFERFYRVDKARSRAGGGTGLGLSIVQWIAQAHGGRVDVQSEMGKGTTFTVHLPLA